MQDVDCTPRAEVQDASPPFDWREHLPVHPLADAYPKVPHDRLVEIGESIRRGGLQFPIAINAKGDPHNPDVFELFDGVTRLNSMVAVGIKFEFERFRFKRGSSDHGNYSLRLVIHDVPTNPDLPSTTKIFHNLSDDEIATYIDNANLRRRQLEPEQYHARLEASHARIKAALERDPEKSNYLIAEETGASEATVRRVRRKSTASGDAVGGKRLGKDGRKRKKPAKKAKPGTITERRLATKGSSLGLEKLQTKAEALGFQVRCKTPGDYSLFNGDGTPAVDVSGFEISFTNLADGLECLENAAKAKATTTTPEPVPAEITTTEPPEPMPARVNARDTALEEFDAHLLRLIQQIKKQKPERFAKTAVSFVKILEVANFLIRVVPKAGDAQQRGNDAKAQNAALEPPTTETAE
jgi:hypothetical protein